MKQFVTLMAAGLLVLCMSQTNAQITQGFEPVSSASPLPSLTANCWSFTGASWDNTSKITGTGSLLLIATTSSSAVAKVTLPFIDFQPGNVISIKYKLSSNLSNTATRNLKLSLLDRDGTATVLGSAALDKTTSATTIFTLTATIGATLPVVTQRLVIDLTGSGDGNSSMYVDEISVVKGTTATVNPAFHYPPGNCNTAPTANDNTYTATSNTAAYSGSSVLNNDADPNGESMTAAVTTQSPDGTTVMNLDGSFTFTPNAGFTGSFTSFTYTVTDNGYSRASNTAKVFLYFPGVSTLPVKLLHFSGAANAQTVLNWSVADNQTGLLFEVQRSTTGNAFVTMAKVVTTEKTGDENYTFTDVLPAQNTAYRLKLVNKDGSISFSPVVSFKALASQKVLLLQNPVQQTLKASVPAGTTALAVYTLGGTRVHFESGKYNNTISLALPTNLPRGTYLLQVITATGTQTATFIEQ